MGKIIVELTAAAIILYLIVIKSTQAVKSKYPGLGIRLRTAFMDCRHNDIFEKFNFSGAKIFPARGDYNITYTNRNGITTNRDISVNRVYQNNGKFAVDAYCHLRESRRTFFNNRINRAVDIDTGDFINSVAQHAKANFNNSAIRSVWNAIGQEMMALYLLAFVYRANSGMMKSGRAVVAGYLKHRCGDIVLDDAELDNVLKKLGAPDPHQFQEIVADMKSAGNIERLRDIAACAKRIVATQKSVGPLEKAAIEMLETASWSGRIIWADCGYRIHSITAKRKPSAPKEEKHGDALGG